MTVRRAGAEVDGALPERFNMARYCVGPDPLRDPDKAGLVVVQDGADPARGAQRLTFAELDHAVRCCAAGLLALGFKPGERIVLRLGNTIEFPLLWFGAMAAGLTAVPTSSQLTAEEIAFVLEDCAARAIAVAPGLEVETDLPVVTSADIVRWRTGGEVAAYAQTHRDDPAFLVYTSGTTGVPKGVLHAHRSAWGRRPMYAGWLGLGREDVLLHAGALNWTYTLGVGLTDPWAVGATSVVYAGARDAGVWSRIIGATGATIFAAVPGVYRQWLARGVDPAAISSLRHAVTAGEALAPALLDSWRAATGLQLYESLGMSEISTFVSSGPEVPVRPGSPGRAQACRPGVAVLPADSDSETPCPTGKSGLLAVHRDDPGLMLGYWNRPDEKPWRGEWFVSSDLVHLDEDGYVHHHGRVDDVMNAMGYRVSPLEVEHCLEAHPAVRDVAVTAVEVRAGVEVIAAFVVPADPDAEGGLDAVALLEHTRAHLAAYKCPREIVFVDSLPRTANGKVIRRELRLPRP